MQNFEQAIKLNPSYAAAYYNRGTAYALKHDYDRAIADFDQAIKLKPGNAAALYDRALAYGAKGDLDRAIAELRRRHQARRQERVRLL